MPACVYVSETCIEHLLHSGTYMTAGTCIDALHVHKIIINVSKRVYYENNNKRQQTLIINGDIFQTVCYYVTQ